MSIIKTAGSWSMSDAPIYFRASLLSDVIETKELAINCRLEEKTILLALSSIWMDTPIDVDSDKQLVALRKLCDEYKVLLDSGAFGLALRYARDKGIPLATALASPVHQIDGYDIMLSNWRKVVSTCGDALWGYIELDLGGRDQKRRTREILELEGFSPIPVFHALSDGWDYFDELVERYERICVGNLAQARDDKRKEIFRMIEQRRVGTSVKWIHYLGVSPTRSFVSSPVESCDSTSYYSDIMYGGNARSFDAFLSLYTDLHYVRKDSKYSDGHGLIRYQRIKALEIMASCSSRALRHHLKASGHWGNSHEQ